LPPLICDLETTISFSPYLAGRRPTFSEYAVVGRPAQLSPLGGPFRLLGGVNTAQRRLARNMSGSDIETNVLLRRNIRTEGARMLKKNERVELEMKIMKYRQMAMLATSDDVTRQRIMSLVREMEQKLREIDE
jgi:hypothetical protein